MDNFQIETAQNIGIQQNSASIGDRVLAFLIDFASAVTVDRVVAKVNGAIITQSNVYNRFMLVANKSDKKNTGPIINERVLMENALNLNAQVVEKYEAIKGSFYTFYPHTGIWGEEINADDYREAINEKTGALLSVHASNFKILGFTHSANISEISDIGTTANIPVLHDLGSGCLLDTTKFGLGEEPRPQDSISSGSTLCFFSGDKLLGGPQAGIIVGKKHYIDLIAKHPLARAFRIDKFSLAALHRTLLHYIRGEAESKIPVWKMISISSTIFCCMALANS